MNLLTDPRALNFLLLGIYCANSIRWACARSWQDSLYWASAFALTVSITFRK
jgi:hypothetical protein